jgi:hypothetical protein
LGESRDRFRRTLKGALEVPAVMTLAGDRRADGSSPLRDVKLEGGGLIIYDPDDEDAWLQADASVPIGDGSVA